MNLKEIYTTPEYLYLADQIENHGRALDILMAELSLKFENEEATKNRTWCIMGDNRPRLIGYTTDDDLV